MKRAAALFIILFTASALYAYDWESKDIKVLSTETRNGETIQKLSTQEGAEFTLRYKTEINEVMADLILKLNTEFRKWENMKVKSLEFVKAEGKLDIIVIPESYTYKNTDFMPSMPAGMLFTYDEMLSYNFRITVENMFIRINGKFFNEKMFSDKITKAIKDPISYLTMYNPKYMLKQIFEHQKKIDELTEKYNKLVNAVMTLHNTGFLGIGVNEINKDLVKRVVELKKDNPTMTKEQIEKKLKEEKIEAKSYEVFLILSVYFNDFKK
jgi:hypothetical protein